VLASLRAGPAPARAVEPAAAPSWPCHAPELPLAAEQHNWPRVARLLAEGVHPDSQDRWGKGALYYAAKAGQLDVVALLHRANATVDLPTLHGSTPLMIAVASGHALTAQLLLDLGADPAMVTCDGRTVASFAPAAPLRTLIENAVAARGQPGPAKATAATAPAACAAARPATPAAADSTAASGAEAGAAVVAAAAAADGCRIRALTFNIRYGDEGDTSMIAWRRRRQRVVDVVRLLQPDVIGFQAWPKELGALCKAGRPRLTYARTCPDAPFRTMQEVLANQLDDLVQLLGNDYEHVGVGRDDGVRQGEFAPIFVLRYGRGGKRGSAAGVYMALS